MNRLPRVLKTIRWFFMFGSLWLPVGEVFGAAVHDLLHPLLPSSSLSRTTSDAAQRFKNILEFEDTVLEEPPREREMMEEESDDEFIERVSGETKGPRIPEPSSKPPANLI